MTFVTFIKKKKKIKIKNLNLKVSLDKIGRARKIFVGRAPFIKKMLSQLFNQDFRIEFRFVANRVPFYAECDENQ